MFGDFPGEDVYKDFCYIMFLQLPIDDFVPVSHIKVSADDLLNQIIE